MLPDIELENCGKNLKYLHVEQQFFPWDFYHSMLL